MDGGPLVYICDPYVFAQPIWKVQKMIRPLKSIRWESFLFKNILKTNEIATFYRKGPFYPQSDNWRKIGALFSVSEVDSVADVFKDGPLHDALLVISSFSKYIHALISINNWWSTLTSKSCPKWGSRALAHECSSLRWFSTTCIYWHPFEDQ